MDVGDRSVVWRVAPGRQHGKWKAFQDRSCVAVGWGRHANDFRELGDLDDINAHLRTVGGEGADGAPEVYSFAYDMQVGDTVVASGTQIVDGIGTISSDYLKADDPNNPMCGDEELPHARRVTWHAVAQFKLPRQIFARQKAVQSVDADRWGEVFAALCSSKQAPSVVAAIRRADECNAEARRDAASGILTDLDAATLEGERRHAFVAHYRRDQRFRTRLLAGRASLDCEACGFDFAAAYGELGGGYAHVHHEEQLSTRGGNTLTARDRVRVVCANCHSMIHRHGECRSVDDIKQRIAAAKRASGER